MTEESLKRSTHGEPSDKEETHVFDNPRNVRRVIIALFTCCAVLFLSDAIFLVHHKHPSFEEGVFPAEHWFGFYGVYGFVACVLLVLIAKQMRKVLMRAENYYEQ